MTILNNYIKASETVADHMSGYYINRDPSELVATLSVLEEQIAAIQAEIDDPTLQETKIMLTKMSGAILIQTVEADNAVTLRNGEYLAENQIEEGKFIRVLTQDQEDGSVYLMKVTLADNDRVILAPVVVQ